jgi:hypothetical protein
VNERRKKKREQGRGTKMMNEDESQGGCGVISAIFGVVFVWPTARVCSWERGWFVRLLGFFGGMGESVVWCVKVEFNICIKTAPFQMKLY